MINDRGICAVQNLKLNEKKKKKGIHEHRLLGKKQGRRYGEKEIKEKNMVNQKREHDLDDIE